MVSQARPGGDLRSILLVLLVVAGTSAVTTPAAAAEDPRFEVGVESPRLEPGVEQTVTVTIENDAEDVDDRAETASAVEVAARSGSTPIDVRSGPSRVGTLADGETATVAVQVSVPADTPGGSYQLPLTVTYEFAGDERERRTVTATLEVPRRPIFDVESAGVDLHPQETGTVTLAVTNDGSTAGNATSATVRAPGSALTVHGGTAFLGDLPPGATETVAVPVTATAAATTGPHELSVDPRYVDADGVQRSAPPRTVGLRVAAVPRFEATATRGTVSPGESGTVEWTLRNRGESTARDVVVRLESTDGAVTLDAGPVTKHVKRWDPGEERTLTASVQAGEQARNGSSPLVATGTYTHAAGHQSETGPMELGVPVTAVEGVELSELARSHAGPQVQVTGEMTYRGKAPLENAAFAFRSETEGSEVVDGRTALGRLDPGETVAVSASLVTDGSPTPVTLSGQLQYDRDGRRGLSERRTVLVPAAPRDTLLAVEPVNATFGIDQTNVLRVAVENVGPTTLDDVQARLAVRPPYESQSPTAYVHSLAPGESTVLSFAVTTPDDGVPSRDALSLNVTGETSGDRTVVDGPHLVPVEIDEAGAGGGALPVAVLAIVVIVLLGGGYWWLNRP